MNWLANLPIRQKELLTGFAILFLICGSFFSAEVILRVKQISEFGAIGTVDEMSAFHRDKETNLRLPVPNAKMGKIIFNSSGFRGPELNSIKKTDVIRIAFLGSSIVFDPYTTNESLTWPSVATSGLQEQFPDCEFEYLNAGLPGLGPGKLTEYYTSFIKNSDPDLVLIMIEDRNGRLNDIAKETGIYDGIHYRPTLLAQHSLFWGKLEKNIVIQKRLRVAASNKSKIVYTEEQLLQRYRKSIHTLINAVKIENSIPVLLSLGQKIRAEQSLNEKLSAIDSAIFFMPYMGVEDFIDTLEIFNIEIQRIADIENIPYIRWHDELAGNDENFMDTVHFTARGSFRLGEILAKKLSQNTLLTEELAAKGFSCLDINTNSRY